MLGLSELSCLKKHSTNGYYSYYIPGHHLSSKRGLVYEHQVMAEIMLGRELNPGEVVHHKDENKKNNSLDNLMVFKTLADHSAFHAGCDVHIEGDVYVADKKFNSICSVCGKQKNGYANMCLQCYKEDKTKNIPTKDVLISLISQYSFCEIGRMFNVSDNAVRKWCKKYSLPFSRKDVRQFRMSYNKAD